jgi:hypothetical protein
VTLPIKCSTNSTLLLGGDVSFDHLLRISISIPYKQGSIPLSSSTLPPSPRVVSFDWNDLVDPRLPSSTPFHIRGILRYIVDKVTTASILSSSTWKDLGFPKIVSAICELLNFDRSLSRYPWPPSLYATYNNILRALFKLFSESLKKRKDYRVRLSL